MARLWTTGRETQLLGTNGENDPEGQGFVNVGSPTINTANARSPGSRACLNCGGSANRYQENIAITIQGRGHYWGVALSWNGTPTQQAKVLRVQGFGGGEQWTLRLETNNTLRLYNAAGTAVGVATGTLSANTYYWVEVYFKVPTSGNGEMELRVNGATITSITPNIGVDVPSTWQRGGVVHAGAGITIRIDDEVCNDDTGAAPFNSWPGDVHISLLKPVSPDVQRSAGWVGGAGGTSNLFDALDNTPPVGDTPANSTNTTQIENAVGVLTNETFEATLAAYTAALASGGAGMAATDQIVAVRQIGRAANLTATTARTLGIKGQSNPSMFEETFGTISTVGIAEPVGWVTFVGSAYTGAVTLGTSPTIRVRKASATTNNVSFDLLGYMVEWREVNVQAATPGGASAQGNAASTSTPTIPTGALGGGAAPQGQGTGTPAPAGATGSGAAPWAATSAPAGGAEAGGPGPSSSVAATPTPGGAAAGGSTPTASAPGSPGGAAAGGEAPGAAIPSSPAGGLAGGGDLSASIPSSPSGAVAGGGPPGASAPGPPAEGLAGGGAPTAAALSAPAGATGAGVEPSAAGSASPGGALAGGGEPSAATSTPAGEVLGGGAQPSAASPVAPAGTSAAGMEASAAIPVPPGGADAGGVAPSGIVPVGEDVPPAGAVAGANAPSARVTPPPGGAIGQGTGADAGVPGTPGGAAGQGSAPTASTPAPPGGAGAGGLDPTASSIAVVLPGGIVASLNPPIFAVPLAVAGATADGRAPAAAVPVPSAGVEARGLAPGEFYLVPALAPGETSASGESSTSASEGAGAFAGVGDGTAASSEVETSVRSEET